MAVKQTLVARPKPLSQKASAELLTRVLNVSLSTGRRDELKRNARKAAEAYARSFSVPG